MLITVEPRPPAPLPEFLSLASFLDVDFSVSEQCSLERNNREVDRFSSYGNSYCKPTLLKSAKDGGEGRIFR